MKPRPLAMTLSQAAEMTPYSVDTLRAAIHAKDSTVFPPPLRAKKDSKRYVILARDLEAWLESLPDA